MIKKLKLGWKIWFLLIVLFLSILTINPSPSKSGVLIKSVGTNSTEEIQGLTNGEIILSFNGNKIKDLKDYSKFLDSIGEEESKKQILTDQNEYIYLSEGKPDLIVSDVSKSNLNAGLDLIGGSRALVKPEIEISDDELDTLISTMQNRFNVYGLSDVRVRSVSDLSGEKFVLIEIAGATVKDLEDLISQQGKFEAKIGEDVVFIGGSRDVTSVCKGNPDCSGIVDCGFNGIENICQFQFTVYLSDEAAQRHADITDTLTTNLSTSGSGHSGAGYLNRPLDLFVDDNLVDSLLISQNLKGLYTTQISVSGSGAGSTEQEAIEDADVNMKRLQTVLVTGSLPFKLNIEKLDTVSSVLGEELTKNIVVTSLIAFLGVSLFIFVRYRNFKITLPIIFTVFSEVFIILGVSALINWNLDLASIAGILVVIGTGLDHQIIILDEVKMGKIYGYKERMKRAFFIIMGAFATTVVAMLPLAWAGTGLLKGFAITTIIGTTAGILVTRPAFSEMVKRIIKD